jgi:hypothetical protein
MTIALQSKNTPLQKVSPGDRIDITLTRKVEIFSQIIRHLTAIVYLVAELYLGQKPEKL